MPSAIRPTFRVCARRRDRVSAVIAAYVDATQDRSDFAPPDLQTASEIAAELTRLVEDAPIEHVCRIGAHRNVEERYVRRARVIGCGGLFVLELPA